LYPYKNSELKRISSILLLSFFVLAIGCKNHKNKIAPSFYYWKSEFSISKAETEYLKQLGCTKLYVRFFDVDLEDEKRFPVPVSVLQSGDIRNTGLQIVPVIFITNRVFSNANDSSVKNLATKVALKIKAICEKGNISPIHEIQIDCDWSLKTRESFFDFLKELRSAFLPAKIVLSATIRLHQVKFAKKTGIPPVDRGMLMYYNMGDVKSHKTGNSILDFEKAERYVNFIDKYPLPLDIALPLYSWGVLFRRGQVIDLVNNLDIKSIAKDNLFKISRDNLYRCDSDHYFLGQYFYKNDILRIEETKYKDLTKAAKQLSRHLPHHDFTLAFYHLDSTIIQKYSNENLIHIINLLD